jgi:ABC-type amino acid transport substrate-binding protein
MTNDKSALRNIRYLILILAILLIGLWLAPNVVASFNRKPDQAWGRIQKEHIIRFAIDASYMPFDGLGSHNDFYGIDVDIANEVARRVGAQAQFILASFDSLYDVLKVGQAEATISALVVDPSRSADWKYSISYFDAGLVLIKPAKSLATSQVASIAVEYGSQADAQARYMARRIEHLSIVYVDSSAAALQSVLDGKAEGAILDNVNSDQLLLKYPSLARVQVLTHEPYSIAVWGESTQLLDAINSALNDMRKDGTIDRIVGEWMRR